MSAGRNSISGMISWKMHKTQKCIYPGDNTMSCCCKRLNGKIWRLRWWKCIMKLGRHSWTLPARELRERGRGCNHSFMRTFFYFFYVSAKAGWIWLEVLVGSVAKLCMHVCCPLILLMHGFCLLSLEHRGKAVVPVFHVNNEFLIWAPHEILISGILAHRGRDKIKSGGSWLSGRSAYRPI